MRGRVVLQLALGAALAALVAGCATGEVMNSAKPWLSRLRPFQGPAGPDVVQMEVALLECPLGDPYVNGELWDAIDERLVRPEQKARVEENGFRVGQVSGLMTPPRLLELLTSKACCANPRGLRSRAGQAVPVGLGPDVACCRFQVERGGQAAECELLQAQCRLSVLPSLLRDGTTCLRITPQVVHGEPEQVFKVAEDRSGFLMVSQRPTESYPELAWEATLGPNEYLVVGGRYERPGTLGHESLIRTDGPRPVQRLLVIRTGALERGGAALTPLPDAGSDDKPAPPPLALQAAWPTVRGQEP